MEMWNAHSYSKFSKKSLSANEYNFKQHFVISSIWFFQGKCLKHVWQVFSLPTTLCTRNYGTTLNVNDRHSPLPLSHTQTHTQTHTHLSLMA
jgi:hypothetical protein